MAFQLSPGVLVVEKDLTSIVPAVATSNGAFAGPFVWGPVLDPVLLSSENELVAQFGKPTDANAQSFFTAANFLSYTSNLRVVRANTDGNRNAVATKSGTVTGVAVTSGGSGYTAPTIAFSAPSIAGGTTATGTVTTSGTLGTVTSTVITNGGTGYTSATVSFSAPGSGTTATGTAVITGGVITGITITSAGSGYTSAPTITISGDGSNAAATAIIGKTITGVTITNVGSGYTSAPSYTITDSTGTGAVLSASIATGGVKINNETDYVTGYINGAGLFGEFAAKYPGDLGNSIRVSMADSAVYGTWVYKAEFDSAPGTSSYADRVNGSNDELHVIVIDEIGLWTGTAGTVLEKFAYVSKSSGARKSDGSNNYYRDVINNNSKYIWWMDHPTVGTNWGTEATNTAYTSLGTAVNVALTGGATDLEPTEGQYKAAFDLFANAEQYDVSLIATGHVSADVAKHVVEEIAEVRRDCVAFVSPYDWAAGQPYNVADDIVDFRNDASFNVNSSYAVLDSGYKYQYDRYNDVYRWIPLNGDVAGLCARTDYTNDAWWSPGGINRGQIKNVVKLAFNPNQTERDTLYKAGVNPVVSFPGQGTVLFGDKTLLTKPSAFDRINVRRLFIVLEKAIATAARYQLFEFNDSFTRAQFKSMVEPFLRDVQGRRGIIDFRVKCDETNNTGEVIDRNEFIADIFIKPARSINFITLNFIAARTAVSFDEIGA